MKGRCTRGCFSRLPILLLARENGKDAHLEGCNINVQSQYIFTLMGRGRKGVLCQSRKKTKIFKNGLTTPHAIFIAEPDNGEEKDSPINISEQLLTAMKKMRPQDLKNTLMEQEEVEEVNPNEQEEFDLTGAGEPVYETPIITSNLTRRIMANEFSPAQVEYILRRALNA